MNAHLPKQLNRGVQRSTAARKHDRLMVLGQELVLTDIHSVGFLDNVQDHLLLDLVLLSLDRARALLRLLFLLFVHIGTTTHTLSHLASIWSSTNLALKETVSESPRFH